MAGATAPISDDARIGVVLVDHGSRCNASNEMLDRFVEMFQAQMRYSIVEPAHMELVEPSIATAFGRCVQRGARCVVVAPYFLAPGKHWREDIPWLTAAAGQQHPEVSYVVTGPIGLHPLMCRIIGQRIDEHLAQCQAFGLVNVHPTDKATRDIEGDHVIGHLVDDHKRV